MYFKDFLVVTKDGKVGDLLLKMYSSEQEGYLYLSNIPNEETGITAYTENEIEIIEKDIFKKFNVRI